MARGVTLEPLLPETVRVESLGTFPARGGPGRFEIDLGDLVPASGSRCPCASPSDLARSGSCCPRSPGSAMRTGSWTGSSARLAWEYADDRANDAQPRDREVDRLVAGIFAARCRQRAVELNRHGDYGAAAEALTATAKKIRGYASGDPELKAIVDGLLHEAEAFGRVCRSRRGRWSSRRAPTRCGRATSRAGRGRG